MQKATLSLLLTICVGAAPPVRAANWWEDIKITGDLRYRHEMIDEEAKAARHRHRIRARIGIFREISSYTAIGIQLATGSDDPVSTNQTLDDAFSTKRIGLDLAYFKAGHEALPGLTVQGGKIKNPFFKPGKSELMWDSDWNPEGGAATFKKESSRLSVTLIGAGLWIDERSSGDDSYLAASQGLVRFHLDEKRWSVAMGSGFFKYVNVMGFPPSHDLEDARGNGVTDAIMGGDTVIVYSSDFEILELFAEISHNFGRFPVTVMGDFVTNTATDSLQTGWLIGLRVGKAKLPGSWSFRYNYRKVESDAVVGIFTDSDFRGGGTDARGHEIGGTVQLAAKTAFNITYFINEIGLQRATTEDFRRLQVDLQLNL